jgi:hypothetical protein
MRGAGSSWRGRGRPPENIVCALSATNKTLQTPPELCDEKVIPQSQLFLFKSKEKQLSIFH